MEPEKLPLVPLDPAIPTNPNIVRVQVRVSRLFGFTAAENSGKIVNIAMSDPRH
jgi:hypothetical protein